MAQSLQFDATRGSATTRYREHAPAADLAGAVTCTWLGEPGWSRRLCVLPDGCCDLSWDGDRVIVSPATTRVVHHPVPGQPWIVGLRLAPHAARAMLGIPPAELTEMVDLTTLGGHPLRQRDRGRTVARLVEPHGGRAMLEELVRRRLGTGHGPDPMIAYAVSALSHGRKVEEIAASVGIGVRQLRQRFTDDVGLGPKALQRTVRFHRFVAAIRDLPPDRRRLARLAAAFGYADQAHLTRECRRIADVTPAVLVARL